MELRPYRSSQKTLIFSTWNFCTTGEKSKCLWLLNGLVWTWFWWTKLLRGPGSTSTEAKINTPKGIRQPQVDVPTTRVTTTTRQALLLRLSNVDPRCCACAVTSGQRFQVSEPPNLRNSWKQNLWLQKTEIMRANAWKEPIKSEKHLIISYPWIHTQKIKWSQIFIYTEPRTKTQLRLRWLAFFSWMFLSSTLQSLQCWFLLALFVECSYPDSDVFTSQKIPWGPLFFELSARKFMISWSKVSN